MNISRDVREYCFASTLQDRKSVMPLSKARDAIINMIKDNPDSKHIIQTK